LSSGLERIEIPPGVIEIESGAFRGCIKLVRVDLPNIETIEECMFMNCESLKGIIIPNKPIGAAPRGQFFGGRGEWVFWYIKRVLRSAGYGFPRRKKSSAS
jgi:hypothetical protein